MKKIYKLLIFIAICSTMMQCGKNTQSTVKDPDDYEYPLSDSLLVELNGLYRKAAETHDYSALEKCTGALVRHYNEMNDYKPAFLLANEYLNVLQASNDSSLMPPALYYVGVVYFNAGLPNYSIDYFLKMIDYPMDDRMQAKVYYAMGENSRNLVQSNGLNPMEYYQKTEAIGRRLNDSVLMAKAFFGQSQMYFDSMGAYKVENMSDGMKDSLAVSTRLLEDAVSYAAKDPNPIYIGGLALNYAAAGEYDKSLSYRNVIESYHAIPKYRSFTFNCMAAIGNYMKNYEEVISLGKEAYEYAEENGRKFDMHHAADIMAYACKAKGDYKNAVLNMEIVRQLEDGMKTTEADMEVLALQVKYDLKVKEQIIARQHLQLLWSIAIIGLIAAGLFIILYFYRQKQRAYWGLFRQIKAQDYLKDELERMTGQYENLLQSQPAAETENTVHPPLTGNVQQRRLVARLHEYLLCDRNFTRPDITHNDLITKLGTNKTYLFEAVKAVTDNTLMDYIHAIRLEESKQMLETRPDLTIEAITLDCGFNNRQIFYRLFHEQYNITPAEYRKIAQKQ